MSFTLRGSSSALLFPPPCKPSRTHPPRSAADRAALLYLRPCKPSHIHPSQSRAIRGCARGSFGSALLTSSALRKVEGEAPVVSFPFFFALLTSSARALRLRPSAFFSLHPSQSRAIRGCARGSFGSALLTSSSLRGASARRPSGRASAAAPTARRPSRFPPFASPYRSPPFSLSSLRVALSVAALLAALLRGECGLRPYSPLRALFLLLSALLRGERGLRPYSPLRALLPFCASAGGLRPYPPSQVLSARALRLRPSAFLLSHPGVWKLAALALRSLRRAPCAPRAERRARASRPGGSCK